MGHCFLKKFKPWEATKIASKFSKAAPFLNVASVLYEGYAHIKKKQQQKEADQKKRELKDLVKGILDEAAKHTCQEAHKAFQPFEESLSITRRMLLQKKSDLANYSTEVASVRQDFEETRCQCRLLYDEIYETKADE